MTIEQVFGAQFALSLLVFSLLAAWVIRPWLDKKSLPDALFWLTVPHAFRHIGLVFVVPGVVAPSMPSSFAGAAAYGDLTTGLLALLALVAVRYRWALMVPLVIIAHGVGLVDLANALRQAEAIPHMGAAWYIPTFLVPMLLVTHAMTFARLLRAWRVPQAPQKTPI
ncbi:MAG: hypothetical protein AAGF81_21190 [Pseudomonadota bacterium]